MHYLVVTYHNTGNVNGEVTISFQKIGNGESEKYKCKQKDGIKGLIINVEFIQHEDGVKAAIKKRMLDEFGLHTIIRLPQVFKPYASVNTNLLFFQKGVPSRGVWFYRLDYPEGIKSFTKTRPMLDKHFDPVREWWADKQPIVVEGKDKARFFTVDELVALNYDFDKCCPFPHEEEEILEPAELIACYQSERAELNANIDRILTEISAMLEVKES